MKQFSLVRIDDRLIHGQIATQWLKYAHGNKVVIIDDKVPEQPIQVRILKAAAPAGVKVLIKTVAEGIEFCKKDPKPDESIVVLVKVPEVIEQLLDAGIEMKDVILGGMGFKEGRTRLNKNVSASPEEVECMKRIASKGVNIYYHLVPEEAPQSLDRVLKED